MNMLWSRLVTKSVGLRFLIVVIALALVGLVSEPALAQTTSTWSGGSGNWSPCPSQGGTALWDTCSHNVYPDGNFIAVIKGGPVFATGASVVGLSIAPGDVLNLTPGYVDITGSSLINQGTINIGSGNGLDFDQSSVTATISGGGTINMLASSRLLVSGNAVINTNNTIQGQGYIGVLTFTNQSLIDAKVSGAQLELAGGVSVTNSGTIQASNGGTLLLQGSSLGVPINNSGGTIQALAGSTVMVDAYAISGGTLVSTGSGLFSTFGGSGNPSLSNLTNNANYQIVSAGSTTIAGTINNLGTIQVKGGLFVNGSATLKGGSVPIAYPQGSILSLSGATTLINQSNIAGSGLIGDANLTLTNQGTINATDTANPLILSGHAFSNTATLEASSGGTLQIQNTINNNGGTIEALAGSTVLIYSNTGMVSGGTLTTSGSGTFDTNSGTLDGTVNTITNAGTFNVSRGNLNLQGAINNTGTIALNTGGYSVALTQPTTLTGSGKVVMSPNTSFFAYATTNTLTNESTIEGAGSIADSNPMGFTNTGTVIANQPGSPLTIGSAGSGFSNPGSLIVNAGSEVDVNGQLNNLSKGTLTGGTYRVSGILQLENAQYTTITSNSANITLAGSAAQILTGVRGPSALASFASNGPKGVFSAQSGQVLSTSANFTNKGTFTVGTGSGFGAGGTYTQTGGTTTVDGVISAPSGFSLMKGKLFGAGTIHGAVTAAAAVNTGDSATVSAVLSVSAYSQTSTGSLTIPIASNVVGTGYGQLASANGVSLAGKLLLKRSKSYMPPIGDVFTIVTGSAITGQFASPILTINSKEHFEIKYNPTSVTLTVVAGP